MLEIPFIPNLVMIMLKRVQTFHFEYFSHFYIVFYMSFVYIVKIICIYENKQNENNVDSLALTLIRC